MTRDLLQLTVFGTDVQSFCDSMYNAKSQLHPALQAQLVDAQMKCLAQLGLATMYSRLNGMSVQQVLEFSGTLEALEPIVEGQQDGLKYKLYGAPTDGE